MAIFISTAFLVSLLLTLPALTQQGGGNVYLPATMVQGLSRANVTGKVYSVIDINRTGIEDVQVCIKHTGLCTISDPNGMYRFDNVFAGSRIITAEELDPDTEYSRFERSVVLIPQIDNVVDILLNPLNLDEDGYRVVLSWSSESGEQTIDLDANFWLPPGVPGDITGYHVTKYIDISNCKDEGSAGSGAEVNTYNFVFPYAYIDVDNTTGSDIETISIGHLVPGKSTFAVLHAQFAGEPGGDYTPLAESNAVVEIYDSVGLIASFKVPPTTTAPGVIDNSTWWHVFNIYDTGEIELINTISGDYPIDTATYTCRIEEELFR